MGMVKQFHAVCTFIIWNLFSFLIQCFETSLGAVVILPVIMIGQLQLTFSGLKHDQTRQNGYQTVHVVCTFIIWCLFSYWIKFSLGAFVILPLIMIIEYYLRAAGWKQVLFSCLTPFRIVATLHKFHLWPLEHYGFLLLLHQFKCPCNIHPDAGCDVAPPTCTC